MPDYQPVPVHIPDKAVGAGADLSKPAFDLLRNLHLIGDETETDSAKGLGAIFSGPPQSVALIEAGATAASKWWAAGLGAAVVPLWAAVKHWWPSQHLHLQEVVLGGTAVVLAALILGIAYLISSDVRGRAAAAVAVIEARAAVAQAMLDAAQAAYAAPVAAPTKQIIPLPAQLNARYEAVGADDEEGWIVIAMERDTDGDTKYVIVKGQDQETVSAADLRFLPA